jgi:hypothetical protein
VSDSDLRRTNQSSRSAQAAPVAGVVQTIADGLSMVIQRPQLMLLPLIVDLLLWLFVQTSIEPLVDGVARFLTTSGAADGAEAARTVRSLGDHVRTSDALGMFIPSIFSGLPLDSLMHAFVFLLVPDVAFGIDREAMYGAWEDGLFGVWRPDSAAVVAGAGLLFLLVGSLMLVTFRVPLARTVRGDTSPMRNAACEIAMAWVRFLGYLLLLAAAGGAVLIPILVASLVFIVLGFNLVFVLTMAIFIFGGMASVYTLFVLDAILLHRIGPVQAISMSMTVARNYFGQTARFAATSLLLATGALQVWSVIVENIPGIAIALVANAFLGTGLSLASMLFYSDRFLLMKASRRTSRS